jgi:type IV pilus assembly protein PilE
MHCHPTSRAPSTTRGFTLIEVMIVVAIVAILSAVAYPSYRDYIVRGALTDGTNGLSAVRAQMERHFQDNRTYATAGTFVSPCASTSAATRTFGPFVVSCLGTLDANNFTLQAVGSGNVASFTYTVNESDVRATTAAATGYNICASSWLTKRGQAC